jgi:hypothetical protein
MRNTPWSNVVAFELALILEGGGETVQDMLTRNNLTTTQFMEFSKDKIFEKAVQDYRQEIRTKGLTFRAKARVQAEELLKTSWLLIHSIDTPAAVKADLIKHTVKWADLEPKNTAVETSTGGVSITINLGAERKEALILDQSPQDVIDYDSHDI